MIHIRVLVLYLLLVGVTTQDEFQIKPWFTKNIYDLLAETEKENFVISPLSLAIIMGLVAIAAEGLTSVELSASANIPSDIDVDDLYKFFKNLSVTLKACNDVKLSNKIFVNTLKVGLKPDFEVIDVDVRSENNYTQIPSEINEIIAKHTQDNFKYILYTTDLTFVNAIEFIGEWKTIFTVDPEDSDMLVATGSFNYYDDEVESWEILEIPFENNDTTLTIVMPKTDHRKSAIIQLTFPVIYYINRLNYVTKKYARVRIPLNFANATSSNLKPLLIKLGVTSVFSNYAELSRLSKNRVQLNDIIQETYIQFNTYEAIASAANMHGRRIVRSVPDLDFEATRPFMYYFIHKILGPLFIGRYIPPEY